LFSSVLPVHDFFFFSSRRRHTRFSRDWSSDVCSSDLGNDGGSNLAAVHVGPVQEIQVVIGIDMRAGLQADDGAEAFGMLERKMRSEERRVGKEWRSRRQLTHEEKQIERRTRVVAQSRW